MTISHKGVVLTKLKTAHCVITKIYNSNYLGKIDIIFNRMHLLVTRLSFTT